MFHSRAAQHRVELKTRIDENLRDVRYDPALRQVFANLVGNALESMESHGGPLQVHAHRQGDRVVVMVADTGHGIETANLRSIFEPFFTTKGERGTGLGLWVTRGIVEEQGGTLRLRTSTASRKHGTCIRVTLPVPVPSEDLELPE